MDFRHVPLGHRIAAAACGALAVLGLANNIVVNEPGIGFVVLVLFGTYPALVVLWAHRQTPRIKTRPVVEIIDAEFVAPKPREPAAAKLPALPVAPKKLPAKTTAPKKWTVAAINRILRKTESQRLAGHDPFKGTENVLEQATEAEGKTIDQVAQKMESACFTCGDYLNCPRQAGNPAPNWWGLCTHYQRNDALGHGPVKDVGQDEPQGTGDTSP